MQLHAVELEKEEEKRMNMPLEEKKRRAQVRSTTD